MESLSAQEVGRRKAKKFYCFFELEDDRGVL